jgi:3-hydroxybutyryl-CoA dehydrogenase
MEIKTIAIIGAGAMGLGVAQVSAAAGYDVVLIFPSRKPSYYQV